MQNLPSGQTRPRSITLEELDIEVEAISVAIATFDKDCAEALESLHALEELQSKEPDIMPRDEVFLISSFMLNVRQAA